MAFETFNLAGKNALVTGGSTGLGYSMSLGLARAGARVMIVGRRADLLKEAAERLTSEAGGAGEILTSSADLYDRKGVTQLAEHASATLGGVDIFIGNAGAVHAELVDAITPENTDQALQLNLVSNISLVQAFLPSMRKKHWGRIIFSSSTASNLAAPLQGNIVYAASKGGLNSFARAVAGDVGRDGITVNCLVFGVFWTSILRGAVAQMRDAGSGAAADMMIENFTEMTAVGRLGELDDLHGIVQLLASDAGGYITGTSIPIDGGTSIMMAPFSGVARHL